jgi:hypothetical protein
MTAMKPDKEVLENPGIGGKTDDRERIMFEIKV